MGCPTSQASSVYGDTTAPPKDTQIRIHEAVAHKLVRINENNFSVPSSICGDTTSVLKTPTKKVQGGFGRGLGRKKANAIGTPFVSNTYNSSSQVPSSSNYKRQYSSTLFTAANGGNKRTTTGFGVFSDPTTRSQVLNPGTSSERILPGPTTLKSASPTNIDIGFKPRGLKWNGKDAVSASQLQQMRASKKKKVPATKFSSSVGTSKK